MPLRPVALPLLWLSFAASASAQRFGELPGDSLPDEIEMSVAAAAADVDGDGDLDLAVAHAWQTPGKPVALYRNGGPGVGLRRDFDGMPAIRVAGRVLVWLDADGDGDQDLFVGTADLQQSRLFENDAGVLTDATSTRLPASTADAFAAAAGDLDADGDLDLLVARDFGTTELLRNDGSGHFSFGPPLPTYPNDRTVALVLIDVEGDGDLDAVLGNGIGCNRLLENDGTGMFRDRSANLGASCRPTTALAVVDMDLDGDLDLVAGRSGDASELLVNDGSGRFLSRVALGSWPVHAIAAADVDGDFAPDLVFGCFGAADRVLFNGDADVFSHARLSDEAGFTNAIATGDFDGDGRLDVYCARGESILAPDRDALYVSAGTAGFVDMVDRRLPTLHAATRAIATGDVDGDGDLDVMIAAEGERNRLLRNDGEGRFRDVTSTCMPDRRDGSLCVALGDLDGDGDLDAIVGCTGQGRILINTGLGVFADRTSTLMPVVVDRTSAVVLGDLDRDGDLDAVLGHPAARNRALINRGDGWLTDESPARLPARVDGTRDLALGDVDQDGDLDLIVAGEPSPLASGENRLLLNDGRGVFGDALPGDWPADMDPSRSVALGDVDGDGWLDVVFGNAFSSDSLYLNSGQGRYVDATATHLPTTALRWGREAVDFGDFDGDGDLDLVFGVVDRQNRLHLNDGTGRFTEVANVLPAALDSTQTLAVFDADADGDPDVLFGNYQQQSRLLFNLDRQLSYGRPARVGHGLEFTLHVAPRPGVTSTQVQTWFALGRLSPGLWLPPFGSYFLDPSAIVGAVTTTIPQDKVVARPYVPFPLPVELVGIGLRAQSFVIPGGNLLALRLSNLATLRVVP
jgi:hypothetical protein